jgi:hypothetical protein
LHEVWEGLSQAVEAGSDPAFLVVGGDDDREKWAIHRVVGPAGVGPSAVWQYTGVDRSRQIIETFDVQFVNNTFIR